MGRGLHPQFEDSLTPLTPEDRSKRGGHRREGVPLCVALRLEPVSIWSTSAKLRAGDRALRTREHLLPLLRESASVRGVSESASSGSKFLRVLSPPSSVAFSHVCVSSLRDTCRLHIFAFCIYVFASSLPLWRGGFYLFQFSIVELCVCWLLRYVYREESCYSLTYPLLKARLGCGCSTILFYVT